MEHERLPVDRDQLLRPPEARPRPGREDDPGDHRAAGVDPPKSRRKKPATTPQIAARPSRIPPTGFAEAAGAAAGGASAPSSAAPAAAAPRLASRQSANCWVSRFET